MFMLNPDTFEFSKVNLFMKGDFTLGRKKMQQILRECAEQLYITSCVNSLQSFSFESPWRFGILTRWSVNQWTVSYLASLAWSTTASKKHSRRPVNTQNMFRHHFLDSGENRNQNRWVWRKKNKNRAKVNVTQTSLKWSGHVRYVTHA